MTTKTKPVDNAAQQVQMMQKLSQAAAAWALGMSPRSLRDHPEIPRDDEGRYTVQDLVAWAKGRGNVPVLSDAQYESVLLLTEKIGQDAIEALYNPVKRLIGELVKDGASENEAVAAVFGLLWNDIRQLVGIYPASYELAPAQSDVVMVCESCKTPRYRYGRQWLTREPHEGAQLVGAECPECLAKFATRRAVSVGDDE